MPDTKLPTLEELNAQLPTLDDLNRGLKKNKPVPAFAIRFNAWWTAFRQWLSEFPNPKDY